MDKAADGQRADIRKLNDGLQSDLEKRGMTFNTPDTAPFRDMLQEIRLLREMAAEFRPGMLVAAREIHRQAGMNPAVEIVAENLPETAPLAGPGLLTSADRIIGLVAEIPAVALVVAEILLLSAGVVARYVFNRPLVWSDELASALFLWLAMLGAVVALRRGEHMRLTVIASRSPPRLRAWLDTLGRRHHRRRAARAAAAGRAIHPG